MPQRLSDEVLENNVRTMPHLGKILMPGIYVIAVWRSLCQLLFDASGDRPLRSLGRTSCARLVGGGEGALRSRQTMYAAEVLTRPRGVDLSHWDVFCMHERGSGGVPKKVWTDARGGVAGTVGRRWLVSFTQKETVAKSLNSLLYPSSACCTLSTRLIVRSRLNFGHCALSYSLCRGVRFSI